MAKRAKLQRRSAGTAAVPNLSWLPSISGPGRVKYLRVIDIIEAATNSGALASGQRLPGQRDMAERLGVTVATVTKAVGDLTRRGLLVAKQGSGTFIAGPAFVTTEAPVPSPPADLALNRPPLQPVQALLSEALATAVGAGGAAQALLGYEPVGGGSVARADGAAWLRQRGMEIAAEDVLVVHGAHEGLLAALAALTQPGDRVLCEALNYAGLRRIAALLRIELVGVPVGPKGLDVEAFVRLCRDRRPRAVVLTPVTHNPTATTLSAEQRSAVAQALVRSDAVLVEDDIYGHLAGDDAPLLAALCPDRTILVTGLSKSIAPGLRLGYVAAPPSIGPRVRDALYGLGWAAPALQAGIASALIGSGLAAACVDAQRAEAQARLKLAVRHLGPGLLPQGGLASYHVWLPLPDGRQPDAFANDLAREGVFVSPAHQFIHGAEDAPQAVRLSLGAVEARADLEEALARVARVLGRQGPGLGAIV
jgi:DNA-binding transcriptional MocR family regulator